MADWTKSMTQTFEYYEVDPISWKDKKRLTEVTGSSITRDLNVDTLGSATIDVVNMVGETYIRIYLVTNQNGITEKHPLGTYLVQTPQSSFDGKNNNVSMDAYTPLIELKENNVPLGYTILKGENILDNAYQITKDNCRCPVVKPTSDKILNSDFVANTDDKYMTFIRDLLNQGKFQFDLDEMGRILFRPVQKTETLQPVCTFNDDNSSILYPEMTLKHDLYGIPNIVEVYARYNGKLFHSIAKNDDPASPTSIVNRGRKIVYRITDPGLPGIPTQKQIDDYAKDVLSEASSLEYTITFTHGYYPCRPGDCVRLNYKRAGLQDIKAKIISQNITCDSGVKVKTTAVFTKKLWS